MMPELFGDFVSDAEEENRRMELELFGSPDDGAPDLHIKDALFNDTSLDYVDLDPPRAQPERVDLGDIESTKDSEEE